MPSTAPLHRYWYNIVWQKPNFLNQTTFPFLYLPLSSHPNKLKNKSMHFFWQGEVSIGELGFLYMLRVNMKIFPLKIHMTFLLLSWGI